MNGSCFFYSKYIQAANNCEGVIMTESGGVETQYFASSSNQWQ